MFLLAFLCFFASAMAQCTEPGTYPDPENPVRCLYCGLAITLPRNCEVCTNASVCLGCKEGYQLSEKPECCYVGAGYYVDNTTQNCLRCPQTIPPNCFSILCEDADSTAECGVCLTGHQLAKTPEGDNTCCSTGTGYFVDPATNICTPCNHITDCLALHCTTATNAECSSCNTTFTKTTPNTCACVAGQYLDAPSHTCKSCSAYCASCTSSLLCNKCDDGFNLANGVCSCPSGKYPVGDLCTTCPIGCSYCVSATECVACSPGYSLPDGDSLGLCTPCPTGCSACAGRVCSTCLSGYIYSQGSCVPPPKCVAGQYLEVSTGSCNACPSGCATCTSPTQCLSCISEYFLPIGSSVCVSGAAFLCNTCDKASTPCSEGHSCCGCDPIGICVPSSQCPTCAALPPCDCSTLDQCALKGSCDSGVDTCKKCVENHQLVSDPSTDLGIACTPKSYQACDLCSGGGIACPSSYTCCCGTCQLGTLPCNRKCPSLYCVKTDGEAEEGVALLEYSVNSDCSHEDEKVTEQVVEGMVWDILGAWGGQTTIVHSCSNNNKRGTTSTLSTSIVLLGPDAQAQALLIIHSIPFNMTANGVVITVVSAEVAESNDLSGGQIAGIVIGSIGCFLLIVIGLYLVLSSNRVDRV